MELGWPYSQLRKQGNNIAKKELDWNPYGKRSTGRPRGSLRKVKENDEERSGMT